MAAMKLVTAIIFLGINAVINAVPMVNKFGPAERPNIKKFRGPRESEGGAPSLANSLKIISVHGFFFLGVGFGLGGPEVLLSGLFFAPASEIKKKENQKIKNGASEMISVTRHNCGTNHRNGERETLSLKAMR